MLLWENASPRLSEALGATLEPAKRAELGIKAFNTEILRSADLSTQQGRDAFVKIASGMDDAGLAALSAAAKMTGLRTEIVTLPDGRTVTVVVNADRAKLDTVKQEMENLARSNYVGTVRLDGDGRPFGDKVRQSVILANNTRASILLGDMLFTHAFHLTSTVDGRACGIIGEATNRVCAGELRQAIVVRESQVLHAGVAAGDVGFQRQPLRLRQPTP